jgi:hypothetical protein
VQEEAVQLRGKIIKSAPFLTKSKIATHQKALFKKLRFLRRFLTVSQKKLRYIFSFVKYVNVSFKKNVVFFDKRIHFYKVKNVKSRFFFQKNVVFFLDKFKEVLSKKRSFFETLRFVKNL